MDDFFTISEPVCRPHPGPDLEAAVVNVPVDSEQYGSGQSSWFCVIA
nr:pheromone precursor [Ganoderma boninense]